MAFGRRSFAVSYFGGATSCVEPVPPEGIAGLIGGSGIPGAQSWLDRMHRLASRRRDSQDEEEAAVAMLMLGFV